MEKTYTVYADKLTEVEKKLKAIQRKANRYEASFGYKVGKTHIATVNIMGYDTVNHCIYKKRDITAEAVDITVECDGLIKANGWTVVARLEHGDHGNIVYTFGDCTEDEWKKWSVAPAICEHCHTNRPRKVTFIVRHENGDTKQIGKTCLKDYTGIDPATAMAWAEITDELEKGLEWDEGENTPCRVFSVLKVLEAAVWTIKQNGYVKSSEPNSTKQKVFNMIHGGLEVDEEISKTAQTILDWLESVDHAPLSIEANCVPLAKSGYCKASHFGLLAYMPVAYERAMERQLAGAKKAEEAKLSTYVGSIGERIEFKAVKANLITSWENAFGYTYLYKFVDSDSNVYIWYASSAKEVENGITVKGSIKDHKDRNGEKRTVLTRCKVA